MGTRRRLSVVASVLLVAGLVSAAPAAAQDQADPYGSTTTLAPPEEAEAGCTLSASTADQRATMTATVTEAPAGEVVRILFDGTEVGRAEALGPSGSKTTVVISFTVPPVEAGAYVVAAVGSTFSAECDASLEVGGVAGEVIDRPGGGGPGQDGAVAGSGRDRIGPLPRTGAYFGLLLFLAIAAILLGRAALEASRRRERRLTAR